jgi:O-antigen/teichoic acid export membrane protein
MDGGLKRLRHWANTGLIAIADQGLISGTNFLVSIILARHLDPAAYGRFGIAFSVYLLAAVAHDALVVEPLAVFASSLDSAARRSYVGVLLRGHLKLGFAVLILSSLMLSHSHVFGANVGLPGSLAAAVLATPCALIMLLLRRAVYINPTSLIGPAVALLYCVLTLTGIALLIKFNLLSAASPLLVLGVVGGICSVALGLFVKPTLRRGGDHRAIARQLWSYGRWALGAQVLTWAPMNVLISTTGLWFGMGQAGSLKALFNFSMPLQQILGALQMNLLPHAARTFSRDGWNGVKKNVRWVTASFAALALCYWAPLLVAAPRAVHALYGGKYADIVDLIPLLALSSIASAIAWGPIIGFRAIQRPSAVVKVFLVMNGLAVLIGVPVTRIAGVRGAVTAMAASAIVSVVVAFRLVGQFSRKAAGGELVTIILPAHDQV